MFRRIAVACVVIGLNLAAARPADAQRRAVGGGLGYSFDQHEDWVAVTGIGWIPVTLNWMTFVDPIVLVPRVQLHPGFERWQVDIGAVWDIPVPEEQTLRPYMGLGVGLARDTQTTPIVNFNAGFRIQKPGWTHQFAAEIYYSAGLDFGNTMVMNFIVMFPIGRR